MTRSDSPEFRFGGLRCDAVEELPRFHLPAPQVLTQDRRLQIVWKLLDPNRLTVTPEAQLTPACSAKVPRPLGLSAWRHQIALPANLQRIHRCCPNVSRLPPAYSQDARPAYTQPPVRQQHDERVEHVLGEPIGFLVFGHHWFRRPRPVVIYSIT